jgi:hypothetical protein
VTWKNEDIATDALSIHGYEHYKAKDYVLAHAPFSGKCVLIIIIHSKCNLANTGSF